MANTSKIFKKRESIDISTLMNELNDINQEKFGGKLYIKQYPQNISFVSDENGFYFWIEKDDVNLPTNPNAKTEEEWKDSLVKVAEDYLEFEDVPMPDYLGWFQELILRGLQSKGYTIYFDSIGEEMEVREPSKNYLDYCIRHYGMSLGNGRIRKFIVNRMVKSMYKDYSKIAKELLPSELYEEMFENK